MDLFRLIEVESILLEDIHLFDTKRGQDIQLSLTRQTMMYHLGFYLKLKTPTFMRFMNDLQIEVLYYENYYHYIESCYARHFLVLGISFFSILSVPKYSIISV